MPCFIEVDNVDLSFWIHQDIAGVQILVPDTVSDQDLDLGLDLLVD